MGDHGHFVHMRHVVHVVAVRHHVMMVAVMGRRRSLGIRFRSREMMAVMVMLDGRRRCGVRRRRGGRRRRCGWWCGCIGMRRQDQHESRKSCRSHG